MAKPPESSQLVVPPLDSWRTALRPQALADRLHAAVVVAVKIASGAGYQVETPTPAQPRLEITQFPSEDWAQPRPVQEAIKLLELVNELVPLMAVDPPHPQVTWIERAFAAGELTARMPAWSGVTMRSPKS
jgi:hypothetical protein